LIIGLKYFLKLLISSILLLFSTELGPEFTCLLQKVIGLEFFLI
jgi:hypothetical protein